MAVSNRRAWMKCSIGGRATNELTDLKIKSFI